MRRIYVFFFLCVSCLTSAMAQDSVFARRIICDLASPQMFGRCCSSHGDSIAANYIRDVFRSMGVLPLADDFFQYYSFEKNRDIPPVIYEGYRTQNVCGFVPGECDSLMVFSAHYDHLGMHGDTIFYGAHDNASGTAAVLDLARMATMKRPYYTMVFLLFSGEEAGLLGSRYAAEHPLFNYAKVRLLCNIDMFCGGDEGFMVVNANDSSTSAFVDQMVSYSSGHGKKVDIKRRNNAPNSDHYWFSLVCPSIFIYTLGGPYGGYHSPTDTCAGCGLGHYQDFLEIISSMAKLLR